MKHKKVVVVILITLMFLVFLSGCTQQGTMVDFKECPICHGTGECQLCGGTGWGLGWGLKCNDCDGSGHCPNCGGDGKVLI